MSSEPPKAKPPADRTKSMPFLDHLEELRWRIIKGLVGVFAGIVVAFFFSDFIIDKLLLGPTRSDFFMYDILRLEAIEFQLQSRRLPGQFFTLWGSLFVVGFIIASPVFFYQMYAFVEPALESSEKKKTLISTFFVTLFFLIGISFSYLILVPYTLQFFAQFQISDVIRNDFDVNEYFSSVSMWILACGVIFQIPVISYSLSKIGLITPDFLKKFRRLAVLLIFILAAFLTPPDPVSQILIAVPLLILYEISIGISAFATKKRQKELNKALGITNSD